MTYLPTNTGSGNVTATTSDTVADTGASPPPFPASPNADGTSSSQEFLSGIGPNIPQQGQPAITSKILIAGTPAGSVVQNNWGQL